MPKAVFCSTKTQSQATQIVDQLRAVGFRNDDISVLFPDKRETKDQPQEQQPKIPEGSVVGGTLGLLAGVGVLPVPGLGSFIAAGPLMVALSSASVGTGVGGISSALIGMGVPESEAKRYESRVRGGNFLISVHADDNTWGDRARDVFKRFYGEDIATAAESALPRPGAGKPAQTTPRR